MTVVGRIDRIRAKKRVFRRPAASPIFVPASVRAEKCQRSLHVSKFPSDRDGISQAPPEMGNVKKLGASSNPKFQGDTDFGFFADFYAELLHNFLVFGRKIVYKFYIYNHNVTLNFGNFSDYHNLRGYRFVVVLWLVRKF